MKEIRILLVLVSAFLGVSIAEAGLKIYYIRHAEGGHNVKADWEYRKVPKNQWPAYVRDHNAFTPKGLVQQTAVAGKLKQYDFDFIAASPAWCVMPPVSHGKTATKTGFSLLKSMAIPRLQPRIRTRTAN